MLTKGLTVIASRGFSAFIVFAFTYVIAQTLDKNEAGIFFVAQTIIVILATFARLGLDNIILRYVAEYESARQHDRTAAIVAKLAGVVFFAGTLVAFVIATSVVLLSEYIPGLYADMLLPAAIAVPFFSLLYLMGEALKGLERQMAAVFFQNIIIPLVSLFVFYFGFTSAVDAKGYVYAYAFVIIGISVATLLYVASYIQSAKPKFDTPVREYLVQAAPLFWASLFAIIMSWTDVIVLSLFREPAAVAEYSVAMRTSLVLGLVLVAYNSIVAPKFAKLASQGKWKEVNATYRRSTLEMISVMLPAAAIMYVFAYEILAMFGDGYAGSGLLLEILVIGQVVAVATGPGGMFLAMTGKQHVLKKIVVVGVLLNIILNILLVHIYGTIGAAVATVISVIFVNILYLISAQRSLATRLGS